VQHEGVQFAKAGGRDRALDEPWLRGPRWSTWWWRRWPMMADRRSGWASRFGRPGRARCCS